MAIRVNPNTQNFKLKEQEILARFIMTNIKTTSAKVDTYYYGAYPVGCQIEKANPFLEYESEEDMIEHISSCIQNAKWRDDN